jgi:rare lipoprotein A
MRTIIIAALATGLAVPALAQQPQQQGTASYYNGGQDGRTVTKSGKPVEPDKNTAASRDLPLGSHATVTNQRTGRSTDVEITDRGPTRTDRQIDVSRKAAQDLGMTQSGTAPVTVDPKGR